MLWLSLDRSSNVPLIRQIYLALRQQILQGQLAAGQKLPATRALAAELGVSRNVILEAYDQLMAEGYLEGRLGSGTYVAQGAFWQTTAQEMPLTTSEAPSPSDRIDFRSGIPALDQFPRKLWAQLTRQVCANAQPDTFGYGIPQGSSELRFTLADYLRRSRGVRCQPEQIVITSGAAQAFGLVVQLLTQPGDTVIIEDPVPQEIRHIFSTRAQLHSISVDERGLQTQYLSRVQAARFVLVTPSHQFPLGSVLTIQRRIELLEFAQAAHCLIVEDDYDSEFRYEGTPVDSLQRLAPDRVIYIGTFSKILSPALRLGYLVLPPEYIQPCRELKRLNDLHTSTLEQLTLAQFIAGGHLERHIAQMKKLYRQRRNALRQHLLEQFSEQIRIIGDSTGLHLVAEFQRIQFTASVMQRIEQQQVKVYPVSNYALDQQSYQQQIVLGYGNLTLNQISTGIQRLQQALETAENPRL